jgi:hypothetical protein
VKAIVKGAVLGGAGALLLGASLALSSATVVSGESAAHPEATSKPIKCASVAKEFCLTVQNTHRGGALEGEAKYGTGVSGRSSSGIGIGVSGNGATGVYGKGTGSNTAGVYGTTSNSSGTGIYGISNGGYGVGGTSSSSDGVYGTSSSGDGVYGASSTGYGGFFESDGGVALYAQSDSSSGGAAPLVVAGPGTIGLVVDDTGDGSFAGVVSATKFDVDLRVRGGPRVTAFSPESTRATIEDTGTARLEGGEGAVRFDSTFASTIDVSRGYQVFLTPDGETRGWLYVAAKYEGGFIVREAEHGRSSIYFDYRVVAHPYGASDARLPQLSIESRFPRLPRHVQPQPPAQP